MNQIINTNTITHDINNFKAVFSQDRKIIGLDVGKKTIGIAISDPISKIALTHKTIFRKKLKEDLQILRGIINDNTIVSIADNNVNLIINNQDAEIINLNNTKKLHGDQLTKEDISYIINPLTNLKLNFGLILRELNNDDGFLNTKYYNISLMSDLFNHYYDI